MSFWRLQLACVHVAGVERVTCEELISSFVVRQLCGSALNVIMHRPFTLSVQYPQHTRNHIYTSIYMYTWAI